MTATRLKTNLMELLGLIYDAMVSPEAWQLWLEKLVAYANAQSGFLILQDTETLDILYATQVGFKRLSATQFGLVLHQRERTALPPTPSQLRNEFYRRLGADHSAGAYLVVEGPCTARISIQRPPGHNDFDDDELAALQQLVPHLQRSLLLGRRVHSPQVTAQVAVNQLSSPSVVVNIALKLIASNPPARTLLDRETWLSVEQDRLTFKVPEISERVTQLVTDAFLALSGGRLPSGSFVAVPREGAAPVIISVMPFGEGVILIFYDPDQRYLPSEGLLKALFGLTPTEARVACQLATGRTVDDCAHAQGVSTGAVKYHLKAIYKKTYTRRQGDLIALLLSLAVQMVTELPEYVETASNAAKLGALFPFPRSSIT